MTRKLTMLWHLRQLMAAKGMFQTTDLLEPLQERGIMISRQMIHRIVTKPPQRINIDLLAALCDIFDCTPADLLELHVEQQRQTRQVNEQGGPSIGDIRPIRAQIRRPDGVSE